MKLTLVKIKLEVKGTKSFFWKPNKEFKYFPGQYLYFTIPKLIYNDSKGSTRYFTISSSPTEKDFIRITTRIRETSGFKKTLNIYKFGDQIDVEGPSGTFILDEHEKGDHVLIAGGIGITPFRSFIKYNVDNKLNNNIYLIYSNSIFEEIAFKKELEIISKKNNNINVVFTITQRTSDKWQGLIGRIDKVMLEKLFSVWGISKNKVNYWLCGPPSMVDAIEIVLGKLGITSDKIRSEKFTGY